MEGRPAPSAGSRRQLDLNGVVKSLAVDRAAVLLDDDGGFVSAGGDLATRGLVDVGLDSGDGCAPGRARDEWHDAAPWLRAGGFSIT